MADDPSVYGSYMNFFLPRSAQVGGPSLVPSPGLFDMLGGMGLGGWPGSSSSASAPGTPAEQQQQQQKKQQQQLAMAQQGMKMLQPQQQAAPPEAVPVAPPQPQQPMPQAAQTAPTPPRAPVGYDPRDPRSRNPIAGLPTPFGGFYR